MIQASYRAKALRFGADGNGTCGRHFPLEDAVEVLFPVPGLRVKTFVLLGLGGGYPPGSVVMELRCLGLWRGVVVGFSCTPARFRSHVVFAVRVLLFGCLFYLLVWVLPYYLISFSCVLYI